MITELSKKICLQIDQLDQISRGSAANQAMQGTEQEFGELTSKLNDLCTFVDINEDRLIGDVRSKLIEDMTIVCVHLSTIKINFKTGDYRQVQALKICTKNLYTIFQNTRKSWSETFLIEIRPLTEAIELIIPFLQEPERMVIHIYRAKFSELARNPPRDKIIHDGIPKLIGLAQAIVDKNMSQFGPSVKKFLQKVQQETATLNDVDPSILKWAADNEFSEKFEISYRK